MRTNRFFACAGLAAMLVNVLPPAALAQAGSTPTFTASRSSAPVNTPIAFTLKLPSAGSQPAPYAFTFGDGATQTVMSLPVYAAAGFSATVSASHVFAKAGTYTVRVKPAGFSASSDTAFLSTIVTITGLAPTAVATSPPTSRPTFAPTTIPSNQPTNSPTMRPPTSAPTTRPMNVPSSAPTAMPTGAPAKPPSPRPSAAATSIATAPPNTATKLIVSPPPGVHASVVRAVTLTWPNGARDFAVAAGVPPPHPVAHVDAAQGRYTLQWIVDGTLFSTVVRDGNGSQQTVELTDPLPINGSGKPHHVEIVVVPQADPFASPPPAQQIAYTVAAAVASAAPYTGPPPAPKQTPFSTAGLHVGVLRLRAPAWGRFEGDSGYKHRTLAGADAGVPVIDDAVHFAWREMNPGTAETFVVHFYLPGNHEIATQNVSASNFRPDAALLHTLLMAAGSPPGDRRAKRLASQNAGKTSLDDADVTWQVEGLHAFAGAPAPIVVERSERWPLAAPIAASVGQSCPVHASSKQLGALKSNLGITSKGNVTRLSGTFSFTDSPYAPDEVQLNEGYRADGGTHTRIFNNVFVDWGDGSIEAVSVHAHGASSGLRNEIVQMATEHVYADAGSQDVRVFALPADVAERTSNVHEAEKTGFPIYCGNVDVVGNDLELISTSIDPPAVGSPPVAVKIGGKAASYADPAKIAAAYAPNCETTAQLTAQITYTGEGDVVVTWRQNGTSLSAQNVHLTPDKYDDAQHPTTIRVLSPPVTIAAGTAKQSFTIEVRSATRIKTDATTVGAGSIPSAACTLTFAVYDGVSYTVDNVQASFVDAKAKADGRISGTGVLRFAIADDFAQFDVPIPIGFTNWKIDPATGVVHDGVLHASLLKAGVGGAPLLFHFHGLAWNVKSVDSHLANNVPGGVRATIGLAPQFDTAKLNAPWPDFTGPVDAHGVFTASAADNANDRIDLLNGWSVDGGYTMQVDSSRDVPDGSCQGYEPMFIGGAPIMPDAFMKLAGVSFGLKAAAFGDYGFCADVSTKGASANLPNGQITVGPFSAQLKNGVAHVANTTISSTLTKPAMRTDLRPQTFKYVVDGGAAQAGIYGMWLPMQCTSVENCPSTAIVGDKINSNVAGGSAAFGMGNVAYVAAPDPASGSYVAAIYGDFSETVALFADQAGHSPDLQAFIDFGVSTVGLGATFISFANDVPYETVTPQTTNVFAKTAIPTTGLSGFVQRDGADLITELHGIRPSDAAKQTAENPAQPVTYKWTISDYSRLTGPTIDIPDSEVSLPAAQPRVHAVLKTAGVKPSATNTGNPGFCGSADFSMMTDAEMKGVFFFSEDGSRWLVSASIGLGSGAPEVIPGVAVLEGVGGGAGYGMADNVFRTAVATLGDKGNTIESPCSVTFPVQDGRITIDAHARVGDAAGTLWTVDGDLRASFGGQYDASIELNAGGWILTGAGPFGSEDYSGAPLQAQLKFANDKLTGFVKANKFSIPPGVQALTLDGSIVYTFGDGTFDINSPGLTVTVPAFGGVTGTFDFNPNSIAAGIVLHYGDTVGCCGVKADYYFDVGADVLVQRSPIHMVFDANIDVGGDVCFFACAGLSVGGGIRIEAPNPTAATLHVDLPDPIGTVSVTLKV